MGKRKHGSGLYAFLDREGVLASGDERLIQAAKRKYWARYKQEWRKAKRKQNKAYTIYLDAKECTALKRAAGMQAMSPTAFIKHAALAAAGKGMVVDPGFVGQVRARFGHVLTNLDELLINSAVVTETADAILNRVEQLEDQVLRLLTPPKPG